MPEKKQLNENELEKVSGGEGETISYDEIESIPVGSEIGFVWSWTLVRVIVLKVDLANDAVYVSPSGIEACKWFEAHINWGVSVFYPCPVYLMDNGTYRITYNSLTNSCFKKL